MSSPAGAGGSAPIPEREPVAEFATIGVRAFTTTRVQGDFSLATAADEAANAPRWVRVQRSLGAGKTGLVSAKQVHGTQVAIHATPWDGWMRIDSIDAHVVRAPVGAAAVTVADCVPVFIAHPGGTVALVHAGWRGTAGRILERTLTQLHTLNSQLSTSDLFVHLGPSICGRCYEVGPDVFEALTGWQTIRNRHVDLRALLAEQAKDLGVQRISASPYCTRCDNDRFFSHRAGDAGRQIAVIEARGD